MKDGTIDPSRRTMSVGYHFYKLRESPFMWDGENLFNVNGSIGTHKGAIISDILEAKGFRVEKFQSPTECLTKLLAKRIIAYVELGSWADVEMSADPEKYKEVEKIPAPIREKPYYLMLSHKFVKDHPQLAEQIWDEIGRLREERSKIFEDVFTTMFQELQASQRTLQQAYDNLEIRVEERTLELARAKEAAEAANQSKSAFLANMSHELRTPLNGILGYAQILMQDPTTPPHQQQSLNIIQKSGEHLLQLINDILDLAKVEANKIKLNPQPFNLSNFTSELCDMMQMRAKAKNLACSRKTGLLPQTVLGDENRLRQVLVNLLGNAIKFTSQGGVTLVVEASPDGNDLARFQIIDTGIGISPEYLETIFDPFEQVSHHTRQEKGTGLGLAISRELVELMGGTLQVKSCPGQGSTFWFDIPLPEVASVPQSVTQSKRPITGIKGRSPKILIVDDETDNRNIVAGMLKPLGFVLAEARGGDGLSRLATFKPDAVILDLVMPKMNGLEMIKRIRQVSDLNHIPLLVSSASSYNEDREQSMAAGADAFVPKPVELPLLLDTLQKQLRLEWVYSETETKTEPQTPLVWPPADILAELIDLTWIGDIAAVQDYANKLVESNPQLAPFSARVQYFAGNFQINQLQSFLEATQEEQK